MQNAISKAATFLQQAEGCRLNVYTDLAGVKTIGYGHVLLAGDKQKLSKTEALQLLNDDVFNVAHRLDWMALPPLNDNQKAALICFVFNVGLGNFNTSHLKQALINRQFDDVGMQWMRWVYVHKQIVKGLISRRSAELRLFNCKNGLA